MPLTKVPAKIRKKVEARIQWTLDSLAFLAPRSIPRYKITATYDIEGTAAGYAIDKTGVVELNPILLIENVDEFIKQIVPHEVVHIIVGRLWKDAAFHGPQFTRLMQILGLPVSCFHTFDTDRCKQADPDVFVYRCMCQHTTRHEVTERTHNMRQKRPITCKLCQHPLQYSHTRQLRKNHGTI